MHGLIKLRKVKKVTGKMNFLLAQRLAVIALATGIGATVIE